MNFTCKLLGHRKVDGYTTTGTYCKVDGSSGDIAHHYICYIVEDRKQTHQYCKRCYKRFDFN